jgi:alpha-L-rhamnosidase
MRKYSLYFLVAQLFYLTSIAQVRVQNLLTENLSNPIGLDIKQPRFSWQLVSDRRNVMQTAYEIKVTSS